MTEPETQVAAPHRGGDRSPSHRGLVGTLAVTQTIGYGVLYYAFAVVLQPISTDLRTSPTVVTGALTLAVLVSAAAAVPVGRWLDRRGGRGLMTTGSVLGTVATVAWSQATTTGQLYAAFAGIGVASAMVLYEPAFAVLIALLDPARRRTAVLAVTIVAGFASSIFIPLTGALNAEYGWRTTILVLAAVQAATVPLHALALRHARPATDRRPARHRLERVLRTALRQRGFWLLAVAFTLHASAGPTVGVHLVTYLAALGHPPVVAAGITGLLGVLSVTGRVLTTGLTRRYSMSAVAAVVFALQAVAVLGLPVIGHTVAGAGGCVLLFGLGFGVATIARPAILAERYDTRGYATISGAIATPVTVVKAVAPMAAAALAGTAGYTPVMVVIAVSSLAAAGCLAATRTR